MKQDQGKAIKVRCTANNEISAMSIQIHVTGIFSSLDVGPPARRVISGH
jgi:hypothetical protein